MFIIELLIYVFFAWVMYSLARRSDFYNKDGESPDLYLWCYMLFFTAISAIRWRVGADSTQYIEIFRRGIVRDESEEFLWNWLVTFVHDWDFHFVLGTAIIAFLQIFFLCKSFKKYKYILVWLPIVLFGGRSYLVLMNGVRQMTVACGYVFLVKYIVERKPFPFLVGIVLLSGIHHSALLLLPTYFLTYIPFDKIKLFNKRTLCLSILLICFVMGQMPSFQGLLKYIENIVSLAGYENYTGFYSKVFQGDVVEKLSMGPIMISFLLCAVVSIWYAPRLEEVYGESIPYFNLWYFLSFLYSCGYFLVCNMSHMLIRPLQYFELFQVVILALLLNYFSKNRERYPYHLYALVFIIWICTIIGVYKVSGSAIEFTTYKTFFGRY